MEEKNIQTLGDWRKKVLEHCYTGIKAHMDYDFPEMEQVKEEFYKIIKLLQ